MKVPGNDLKARVEYFGDWDYQIKVAGVSFRQQQLGQLYGEDWNELDVRVAPEPTNPYDENAVAIWVVKENGSLQLGYIPAKISEALKPLIEEGKEYECALVYITSGNNGKIRTAKIAMREKQKEES